MTVYLVSTKLEHKCSLNSFTSDVALKSDTYITLIGKDKTVSEKRQSVGCEKSTWASVF